MKRLKIAVISDLHCHHSSAEHDDTFLTSDLLRTDPLVHPVEGILEVIKKDNLTVDVTLCPGDFTNQSDSQGLVSGWDFSLEINNALGGSEVIATLGNHDVDSHANFSSYSLDKPQGIKKGFPISKQEEREKFWGSGFVILERQGFRILVINSSHFHHNKIEAGHGKVSADLISQVKKYMDGKSADKINLVLAHHHPKTHSRADLGEDDTIVNGEELLEALGPDRFDLFVHGHKHDPHLRYHHFEGSSGRIPILSAGSFSAKTNLHWTGQRNAFHIITIEKSEKGNCTGTVSTWTYMRKSGWRQFRDDGGFPPNTGFGSKRSVSDLVELVKNSVGNKALKKWEEVLSDLPDLKYLLPNEAEDLYTKLDEQGLVLDKKLSMNPKLISNTSEL